MAWHHFRHAARKEGKPQEIPSSTLIRWLLGQVSPMRARIIILVISALVSLGLNITSPYIGKLIVDEGIVKKEAELILRYSLMLVALAVAGYALGFLRNYLSGQVNQKLLYEMRTTVFKHLGEVDVDYVSSESAGKLISLVTNDIDAVGDVVTSGTLEIIVGSLTLVGTLYVMISLHLTLSLATFSVVPAMFIVSTYFARKTREAYRATREKISELTSNVEQSVSGSKVSQSFVERKDIDAENFDRVSRATMGAKIRARVVFSLVQPSLSTIRAISSVILIAYGGSLVASASISVGTLIAFYGYTEMFFRPVITLTTFYSTVQAALAAAERVYIFVRMNPTVTELDGAREIEIQRGEIVLKDISFSYGENKVFEGLNFTVGAGDIVAIVGPTGAGKTTVTNLLMRLYDPQSGKVLIDGQDAREFTFRSLRAQMALVPQEPILFNETVLNNIRMGKAHSSEEEVRHIVSELGMRDLIATLPEGYSTVVSPGGSNLSVGQRQLISFARTMFKDPKILIIDEATSSLDPYTESLLQKAMVRLMKGRTCIVIAHRLSTVSLARRIVVLGEGEIVEEGTHEELISKGGTYEKLYELQFGAIPVKPHTA